MGAAGPASEVDLFKLSYVRDFRVGEGTVGPSGFEERTPGLWIHKTPCRAHEASQMASARDADEVTPRDKR